ncbi:Abhydrolase domain-containing protein FAM108A [Fasciola hepatica]|uniref:Abhydrolase domain-containing protein FAM108A n=1 Tax=Fasciola hepatica TaxID=6192 RepID=A0A4E0R6H1_FASHE|nr:Abhydrolase domain-containing protein FAM108A [Fasciola hepatica]
MYVPANTTHTLFGCTAVNLSSNRSSRRGVSPMSLNSKTSQGMSASCPTLTDECSSAGAPHPAYTGDSAQRTPYTVLFSHGNAVDIGQMAGFLQSLAHRFGVNILCYDYSGYGASSGQRLEENLYADAEAVLRELQQRFQVPLEKTVLYGQSIGTAPTVDLATKYKVAGVVLHSPFMSGLRVVCPGTTRRFCFDPFTNIDKVARILSPTLIIHGTDDEIIGIHHGHELYSQLKFPLEPAWIEGAGHNDIELFAEYAIRLDRFFNEDLGDGSGCPTALWTVPYPCRSPVETLTPHQSFVRPAFSARQSSSASRKTQKKPHQHHQPHNGGGSSSIRRADVSPINRVGVLTEVASVATNGHLRSDSVRSGNPRTSRAQSTPGHGDYPHLSIDAASCRRVWTVRKDMPGSQLCRTSTVQETLSSSERGTNSSNCSRSSSEAGAQSDIVREGSGTRHRSKSSIKMDSAVQPPQILNETRSVQTTTTTAVILRSSLDSAD